MLGRSTTLMFCASLYVTGCASNDTTSSDISKHMIAFAPDGDAVDPNYSERGLSLGERTLNEIEFRQRVRCIMDEIQDWRRQPTATGEPPHNRIVLFIHGGLNAYELTNARVMRDAQYMRESCGVYPIYIAWKSSFASSYLENLALTNGRFDSLALAASPYTVVTDLVRGALNVPQRVASSIVHDLFGAGQQREEVYSALSAAIGLEQRFRNGHDWKSPFSDERDEDVVIPIEVGHFRESSVADSYRLSQLGKIPTLPIRATMSFAVDAFGRGAWDGMNRRTGLLFARESNNLEFSHRSEEPVGLAYLLQELAAIQPPLDEHDLYEAVRNLREHIGNLRRFIRERESHESWDDILTVLNAATVSETNTRHLNANPEDSIDPGQGTQKRTEAWESWADALEGIANLLDPKSNRDIAKQFSSLTNDEQLAKALTDRLTKSLPDNATRAELIDALRRLIGGPALKQSATVVKALAGGTGDRSLARDLRLLAVFFEHNPLGLGSNEIGVDPVEKERRARKRRDDLDLVFGFAELRLAQALARMDTEALEVELIGHSMGCIVANEVLRQSQKFRFPRFHDIVYMAAACSISDYEKAVWPYLATHAKAGTRFHHVVLHPLAEESESAFYDLVPRGSLLVWIDNYLSKPRTMLERTSGQFVNLIYAVNRTPREIQRAMTIRVMPFGEPALTVPKRTPGARMLNEWYERYESPRNHGDFSQRVFWDEDFWDVAPETHDREP